MHYAATELRSSITPSPADILDSLWQTEPTEEKSPGLSPESHFHRRNLRSQMSKTTSRPASPAMRALNETSRVKLLSLGPSKQIMSAHVPMSLDLSTMSPICVTIVTHPPHRPNEDVFAHLPSPRSLRLTARAEPSGRQYREAVEVHGSRPMIDGRERMRREGLRWQEQSAARAALTVTKIRPVRKSPCRHHRR